MDDFLNVSAIEAGKFDLDLQTAYFNEVVSHYLQVNQVQAAKKGIDLDVQCDDDLPAILMNIPKMEQAIINLVSNAIEHSNPNTMVSIALFNGSRSIVFPVKDSGAGIASADIDRLFQSLGKTTAKKTAYERSLGFGMLIARKIIEAHDGKIWIDSIKGKGTIVNFKIPK